MQFEHIPVLLTEALDGLQIKQDGLYLDCTLGGAGHSWHILNASSPHGRLIGIDQDQEAITAARVRLSEFAGRWQVFQTNFANIKQIVTEADWGKADGILMDLGVSSYQLDNAARGFSYMHDAPLDMRMDCRSELNAAQLVNEASEQELDTIIREYGEERWAKRISQFIVAARAQKEIQTTAQLVEIIKQAIPAGARREGPHPAKRTFQALRIAVNNELGLLHDAITAAVSVLKPGGRICVITFHSLEDRIVKETFHYLTLNCICPPKMPVCQCHVRQQIRLINRKPILPGEEELKYNSRARSAKLRIAEKL